MDAHGEPFVKPFSAVRAPRVGRVVVILDVRWMAHLMIKNAELPW